MVIIILLCKLAETSHDMTAAPRTGVIHSSYNQGKGILRAKSYLSTISEIRSSHFIISTPFSYSHTKCITILY